MTKEKEVNIQLSLETKKLKEAKNPLTSTPIEVQSTHTAELVIALCGPIGSPLHEIAKYLKELLSEQYLYECNVIKLSKIIEDHSTLAPKEKFERIKHLIEHGNKLREEHSCSILADLAIAEIATDREDHKSKEGVEKFSDRRVCHIVDSLKNQEELEALKLVYRDMLYVIGVFSPQPFREERLNADMNLAKVHQLIDRDSGEEVAYGQTVRETFPHSDFFLRVDSLKKRPIEQKLERLLHIIFETEVITPSFEETAMYNAASAASNSACLSRQVGAALTDEKGEIISIGWNDVPKFGGDVYRYNPIDDSGTNDHRCIHLDDGYCSNDAEKNAIVKEITKELFDREVIDKSKIELAKEIISKSKLKNLIEFSRSIHAEMHAIILGSQLAGDKVRGGKLFCTTYPCHSCARHIILSGISEVYYIEPYRKSLATKLHKDAITESENDLEKVRILPFDGVSPERYLE